MAKRFSSQAEIDEFLAEPRLAILMYQTGDASPVGVPVWFDWDGAKLQMFSGRGSPKVSQLEKNPAVSVLVTNSVGEQEGWVAFDGEIELAEFETEVWTSLIDRVAPRYWDLSIPDYATEISNWRSMPEAFISMSMTPTKIRSGA